MKKKAFLLYASCISIISIWWYLAFYYHISAKQTTHANALHDTQENNSKITHLASLQRQDFIKALAGDIDVIQKLLSSWQAESIKLKNDGNNTIQVFNSEKFYLSKWLAATLKNQSEDDIALAKQLLGKKTINDDSGKKIVVNSKYEVFLPQTYVSAGILLALVKAASIAALPVGIKEQKEIYPEELTKCIEHTIDRYSLEKLYNNPPQLAFVASYSDPMTLESLRSQGVELFTLDAINNVEEITEAIRKVGHIVNEPLRAELLALFIEGAMIALDNRLNMFIKALSTENPCKVLLAYHFNYFSVPAKKCITTNLLYRILPLSHMISPLISQKNDEWLKKVSSEDIYIDDPDYLIIASADKQHTINILETNAALKETLAIKRGSYILIDESIQQNVTQYVVLAYFDIIEALRKLWGIQND